MKLRSYQKNGIERIKQEVAKGNRSVLAVSPTGSGKAVCLTDIIRSAASKGSQVLFLVHSREIIFQVSAHLERNGIEHGTILAGEDFVGGHKVNVASVQTLRRRMQTYYYPKADVIIIDEAHNSTAKEYRAVIEHYRENVIIGFTATPCRATGHGLGTLYDVLVNFATIADLTDQGYLAPIRYFCPSIPDLSKVKLVQGDYNLKQIDGIMRQKTLVGDIVTNWARLADNRQTIVFTTTVAHSIAVCDSFNAVGVPAEHVDGKTNKNVRADIINAFRRKEVRVLCNCAVFTEGVDIPDISCVIMARPTKSLKIYMQAIGRGMRVIDGKENLIFIDHSGVIYEHGPVEEITDWHLDETTENGSEKNNERKKKETRPITCHVCGCVYTGQLKCPECRTIPDISKAPKDVDYIDAELGEYCLKKKEVKKKTSYSDEEKQTWYSQLIGMCKEKGWNTGAAYHKYREKFGVYPPNTMNKNPMTPGVEVRSWFRSQQQRYLIAKRAKNV